MWHALFVREITALLGNRWSATLVLGPLLLLSGLVVARWPSQGEVDVAGVRAREMFALVGYATLGCVLILTPAYPATAIVRERIRGTLALLLQTPLSRVGVYAGKFLGISVSLLLPLVMSTPAIAACYAMGGIDLATDVFPFYAIVALTIVEYVSLSLWISCFASTPSGAIRAAYGAVVVLSIMMLGPSLLVPQGATGAIVDFASWLQDFSPIPAVMAILEGTAGAGQASDASGAIIRFSLTATLLTACFALHTAAMLTPTMLDRIRATGTMTQDRSVAARSSRRVWFIIDPQRRASAMPDWINPVLVKEFRSRRFGRGHWLVRLVAACAIASLALSYVATTGAIAWSPEAIGATMVLLQAALIILFTPSLGSGIISDEHEMGGWTLLCMTPLSARQIVLGKLLSAGLTVSLVLLATLPGYAVMILVKPVLYQQVRDVLLMLVLIAAFAVCLSGAVSAFFRRTTIATVTSQLLLTTFLAAPMIFWLAREAPFGHRTVDRALAFSPLAGALKLLEAPGFTSYQPLPTAWWTLGMGIAACLIILCWQTWQLTRPR
ncbi:MAG: ABC transporter permease subunit [Pirellulales bacterium]|nr:ABC transporter permease subunit [Pirellulales bacterium]